MARLGAGLSLTKLRTEARAGGSSSQREALRPGLVLDGTLALPARTRLFVELSAQYRWVLPASIGPIDVHDYDGTYVTTFPETSVSASRWVWRFGVGLRL